MTEDRLRTLVAEILRLPSNAITDDLDMETTSTWDSLSHMSLIAAIEDEFHVELTGDDIVEMTDMAKIRDIVAARSASA